ncbi:MAG: branched-chain amino acid ABC transporter permease [Deltaproteobacteria bacterium]|nr:branched-chain amino acid ABC transporter permease [Deltaproteobacteria bacterium]
MGIVNILLYFATMMGIYAILALSLNFHYGFSGLVNFGHVAFFAVGAYASALVTMMGAPFLVGVLLAGALAGLLGFIVALPTSKLSIHYWAITTLGIGEIIRLIAVNEEWLTRGSFGIIGIPQPLHGVIPNGLYPLFYLCVVVAFLALTYLVIRKLADSPFGRVLKAVREEDDLALAMGKPVFYFKVEAMTVGAIFAGIAGALFAHYITYISPLDFMPIVTFIIWAMVIVGGRGNALGSVVGAVIIVVFFNSTRFLKDYLPLSGQTVASLRMVAIGVLIILVVLFMRGGLIKEKKRVYRV